MRQTFQQWMVLLSALVLLLLPALLCHAAPMEFEASSSSVSRPPNPPGIQDFGYYGTTQFGLERNRQPLTDKELEEQFSTHIHYERVPVLHTDAVHESTVKDALKSYGKVWLVGPPSDEKPDEPRYTGLELLRDGSIGYPPHNKEEIHVRVRNAKSFGSTHGKNSQDLLFGRPFKRRRQFLRYETPSWEKVLASKMFDVRGAKLTDLRTYLNKKNRLKAYDSVRQELLGFVLDKEGKVSYRVLHSI
ncbi:uncharacterized protein UHOD_11554 [Ustilago sp. UG-2017b]|nr:uncharacterized protein UHOD_04380 [Ustilago sp. UG-2017b]SPC62566.1 uncharacterized protein UHOD_11554 [Ustilago sp. UG-2017b]